MIARIDRPTSDISLSDSVLGGQHPWTWAVGLPYRALVSRHGGSIMPSAPTQRTDIFDAVGYFAVLQSFLTYSFGWPRHDKGLIWWCDAGMPTDDPRFALIRETWVEDGLLDSYVDWCTTHPVMTALDAFADNPDHRPLELSLKWRRRLPGEVASLNPTSPYGMHLEFGDHIRSPSEARGHTGSRILGVDPDARTATLVAETVTGWYASLVEHGEQLPPLTGGRSWRIDVFVKPIGFVGTYRRSKSTGLWFSGRHAYHVVGS